MTAAQMRLSFREEGKWWVAYGAQLGTMQGAVPMGRIAIGFVRNRPERKGQFMDLMRDIFGDWVEELTGQRPTWPNPPERAPEHERAGQA